MMAQMMVRPTDTLVAEDSATQWFYGEFAVIAGWGFFVLGLLKGLWTALWWIFTPRKPGREGKAEASIGAETLEKTCMQCGKTEDAEIPGRCWSPRRECSKKRQVSATPERHPRREWAQELSGKSPEARQAQTRIVEAMVQRAHSPWFRIYKTCTALVEWDRAQCCDVDPAFNERQKSLGGDGICRGGPPELHEWFNSESNA